MAWWMILLGAIFVGVVVWWYTKYEINLYGGNGYVTNQEYISKKARPTAEVVLFYTTWCPECKAMEDDWNNYINNYKNDDYEVSFTSADGDKSPDMVSAYKVKEFPTIVLVRSDTKKKYVYDANFDAATMDKFITTIMSL
jgi:thiol-disulfide isomerase/thioredoxin